MKGLNSNTAIVFSNTVRGVSSSLLNAFICFVFTALDLQSELKDFVIFFTAGNLLIIVLNWGLKDYSIKLFASDNNAKNVFSKLFSLRICLFVLVGISISFVPLETRLIACVLLYVLFKFINNTIEAYSTFNNKNHFFAFVDILSFCFLLVAYFLQYTFKADFVFVVFIIAESLKMIIGISMFNDRMSFRFIDPLPFLKQTGNYFFVAFFSFLLSKADFYISSFYLHAKELINYHIYSSLVGLSQVIITSFFSRQMVNWFKSKEEKFSVNAKQFFLTSLCLCILALPCFYFITLYFYKFTVSANMLAFVFFNLFVYSFILLEIYLNTHQNKHALILAGVVVSSIVNIILSFVLIKYYHIQGAILANIISLFVLYLYFKLRSRSGIGKAS
ncbi:MAG: hypothetical protein H0U95_08000 [Bacteroidetes bacterium]|nr:hypothetical protein [Bacteroidota bacterium]